MNTLLSYKEDSLRKIKETLRKKNQQDGDESCESVHPSNLSGLWIMEGVSEVTLLCFSFQSMRAKTSMQSWPCPKAVSSPAASAWRSRSWRRKCSSSVRK